MTITIVFIFSIYDVSYPCKSDFLCMCKLVSVGCFKNKSILNWRKQMHTLCWQAIKYCIFKTSPVTGHRRTALFNGPTKGYKGLVQPKHAISVRISPKKSQQQIHIFPIHIHKKISSGLTLPKYSTMLLKILSNLENLRTFFHYLDNTHK